MLGGFVEVEGSAGYFTIFVQLFNLFFEVNQQFLSFIPGFLDFLEVLIEDIAVFFLATLGHLMGLVHHSVCQALEAELMICVDYILIQHFAASLFYLQPTRALP